MKILKKSIEKDLTCNEKFKWYNIADYRNSFENVDYFLTIFKPMQKLKEKIKLSGLKQNFIADKVGIGNSHLTMMLNGNAAMPEEVRNKIDILLKPYISLDKV